MSCTEMERFQTGASELPSQQQAVEESVRVQYMMGLER